MVCFHMIDQNLNIKFQVKRWKILLLCNKARVIFVYKCKVWIHHFFNLTKWLVEYKGNWFIVFIYTITNKKKQHLIELYSCKTHVWTITRTKLCLQNKEFIKLCILLIIQYLKFKIWQSVTNTNIKNSKH